MKKILKTFFVIFLLFLSLQVNAAEPINGYFFYGQDCPHCAKEGAFLESLMVKYPELEINKFEIYYNKENAKLMQEIAETLKISINGVPFLFIGDQYFIGYSENITSIEVEDKVQDCLNDGCSDVVGIILDLERVQKEIKESPSPTSNNQEEVIDEKPNEEEMINSPEEKSKDFNEINTGKENIKEVNFKRIAVPFLGEINPLDFSLPALTVIMGFLDGFNPCAMWVLLFLISLLLGMENRKKMWILGTAFIVGSAAVYFLFMSAWLNLILFLGFVFWLRLIIGFVALGGGLFGLKEFFFNKKISGCNIVQNGERQKIFNRLKKIINQKSFWISFGGIIILAFAVNLIELVCSAGLPAVYTQVLALNNLTNWKYYLYILLYILFFMLDDLFVFFMAMITLQMTGITTKYSKYSRLIGGLLMIIIGLLLIFKPSWLMFG